MIKTFKIWMLRLGVLAMPFLASAQDIPIVSKIPEILNTIVTVLFIAVTAYFFWGVIKYVMAGGDDKAIEAGKSHMLWGIIGMAAMLAAWAIVRSLIAYFGFEGAESNIPQGL